MRDIDAIDSNCDSSRPFELSKVLMDERPR